MLNTIFGVHPEGIKGLIGALKTKARPTDAQSFKDYGGRNENIHRVTITFGKNWI